MGLMCFMPPWYMGLKMSRRALGWPVFFLAESLHISEAERLAHPLGTHTYSPEK